MKFSSSYLFLLYLFFVCVCLSSSCSSVLGDELVPRFMFPTGRIYDVGLASASSNSFQFNANEIIPNLPAT